MSSGRLSIPTECWQVLWSSPCNRGPGRGEGGLLDTALARGEKL
jgi:hypothetical protein